STGRGSKRRELAVCFRPTVRLFKAYLLRGHPESPADLQPPLGVGNFLITRLKALHLQRLPEMERWALPSSSTSMAAPPLPALRPVRRGRIVQHPRSGPF